METHVRLACTQHLYTVLQHITIDNITNNNINNNKNAYVVELTLSSTQQFMWHLVVWHHQIRRPSNLSTPSPVLRSPFLHRLGTFHGRLLLYFLPSLAPGGVFLHIRVLGILAAIFRIIRWFKYI